MIFVEEIKERGEVKGKCVYSLILTFWKGPNFPRLFYHYRVTFNGTGNFLIQLGRLFDDKYLYAGFVIAEALSRAHHAGEGHQFRGVLLEHFLDRLFWHDIFSLETLRAGHKTDGDNDQTNYESGHLV